MKSRFISVSVTALICASCATAPQPGPVTTPHAPDQDLGLLWVKHAAEYKAIAAQTYKQAGTALGDLLGDKSWSALPGQRDAEDLPPAIIFDVDETVLSNVDFQLTFERPFDNWKLDEWSRGGPSTPVPGFTEFAAAARAAGVTLFFVTNRPCEPVEGNPCPQERTTIDDIVEAGIETDAEHVLLAFEEEGWGKEKLVRRELLAETHRIIMLIGDDLSDFVPCVREKPSGPCTEPATAASREALLDEYGDYFGAGWYILPNPMHGSWTTVK